MKKFFLLLIFFSAVQLYSQGANYPYIMNNGTIFINAGVGFGKEIEYKTLCPPLTVSMDIAIPVINFPITLGIITGYFSESDKKSELSGLILAGRIAYHINLLNLPRLDAYALVNIGAIMDVKPKGKEYFLFGVLAGARYFFLPNLGAYIEAGFDTVRYISFGLSFKL